MKMESDIKKLIQKVDDIEQKLINVNASVKFRINEMMLIIEKLMEDKNEWKKRYILYYWWSSL